MAIEPGHSDAARLDDRHARGGRPVRRRLRHDPRGHGRGCVAGAGIARVEAVEVQFIEGDGAARNVPVEDTAFGKFVVGSGVAGECPGGDDPGNGEVAVGVQDEVGGRTGAGDQLIVIVQIAVEMNGQPARGFRSQAMGGVVRGGGIAVHGEHGVRCGGADADAPGGDDDELVGAG